MDCKSKKIRLKEKYTLKNLCPYDPRVSERRGDIPPSTRDEGYHYFPPEWISGYKGRFMLPLYPLQLTHSLPPRLLYHWPHIAR